MRSLTTEFRGTSRFEVLGRIGEGGAGFVYASPAHARFPHPARLLGARSGADVALRGGRRGGRGCARREDAGDEAVDGPPGSEHACPRARRPRAGVRGANCERPLRRRRRDAKEGGSARGRPRERRLGRGDRDGPRRPRRAIRDGGRSQPSERAPRGRRADLRLARDGAPRRGPAPAAGRLGRRTGGRSARRWRRSMDDDAGDSKPGPDVRALRPGLRGARARRRIGAGT